MDEGKESCERELFGGKHTGLAQQPFQEGETRILPGLLVRSCAVHIVHAAFCHSTSSCGISVRRRESTGGSSVTRAGSICAAQLAMFQYREGEVQFRVAGIYHHTFCEASRIHGTCLHDMLVMLFRKYLYQVTSPLWPIMHMRVAIQISALGLGQSFSPGFPNWGNWPSFWAAQFNCQQCWLNSQQCCCLDPCTVQ